MKTLSKIIRRCSLGAVITALGASIVSAQPGTPCVVAAPPEPWAAVVLNVRVAPNGPVIGALFNGTPIVLTGQEWERWVVIDNGFGLVGWAFAPYLACALPLPPPPLPSPQFEPYGGNDD